MHIDNIQYQDCLRLRTLLWEKQTFCINGTVIMKGFQPDIKPSQGYFSAPISRYNPRLWQTAEEDENLQQRAILRNRADGQRRALPCRLLSSTRLVVARGDAMLKTAGSSDGTAKPL